MKIICVLCGQLSVDLEGKYMSGNALEVTPLTFSNFLAALNVADFQWDDVVFIDIAFDNLSDLPEINQLYMELFPENKRPARTIYQAETLPFGGKLKLLA